MKCLKCECEHSYCSVAFFLPIRQCVRCDGLIPGFLIYLMAGIHYLFTGKVAFDIISYKGRDEEFNLLSYIISCKVYLRKVVFKWKD